MKTFRIHKKYIAGLALLLACNVSLAEFIEGENPQSFYLRNYQTLRGKSDASRPIALGKAELASYEEFINLAIEQKLVLSDELKNYSDKISKAISLNLKGRIVGAKVTESRVLADGRAICVLEIPKQNLDNFNSLDLSQNPKAVLTNLDYFKLLKLELALLFGEPNIDEILEDKTGVLKGETLFSCAHQQKAIPKLSRFWVENIDTSKPNFSSINDNALLNYLEIIYGDNESLEFLLEEFSKRGYPEVLKFVLAQKIPTKTKLHELESFETESKLVKILLENDACIDFLNSSAPNDKFNQAQALFQSAEPDFKTITTLILESLRLSISDSAINLLGRCYEEESMPSEAIVCYLQALSMNPKQAYAKYNLAQCFYKLGQIENSKKWIANTLEDNTSAKWAKDSAKALLEEIEN